MSTRGVYGFRKKGIDKLSYNDADSYPDDLGETVVSFCRETSIDELNAIYDKIIMVNSEIPPTVEQFMECKKWSVNEGENWADLLYKAEGDLLAFKNGLRYMLDGKDFIKDSLFCEHGYIINLDDNTLEYWKGFQREPQEGNRYGTDFDPLDEVKYYPCKMVMAFPLDNIHGDAVEQMNNVNKDEEE